MPDIELTVNERQLKEIQRILRGVPRALPKVVSRAINKSATRARAESVRKLAKHVNLKQKRIREDIQIQKATYSNWSAAVQARGSTIPIREFATTKIVPAGAGFHRPKRGITYMIERAAGRRDKPRGFFARMDSGHIGVFVREGKERLHIHEQFGPSVGGTFANALSLIAAVTRDAYQNLEKNLDTQVDLILRKNLQAKEPT